MPFKSYPLTPAATIIQNAILVFLAERKQLKIDKLADPTDAKALQKLTEQFDLFTWLDDAQTRAWQLKLVTHIAKGMHSGAKGTSSLYAHPSTLQASSNSWVGSNCLVDFQVDAAGNAAALDIYKFLMVSVGGCRILDLIEKNDADLKMALHSDAAKAQVCRDIFADMLQPKKMSAHTLTKQILWPMNNDIHNDDDYRLLLPLHPISLIHYVANKIRHHRFSEEAKLGRAARKENVASATVLYEYPNMAQQFHGGTKPQNVSQLTSELGGGYYLLASLPPILSNTDFRPVHHQDDALVVFSRSDGRETLRNAVTCIRVLHKQEKSDVEQRTERNNAIDAVADAMFAWTLKLRNLDPLWLDADDCLLSTTQKNWFDPRAEIEHIDCIPYISKALTDQLMHLLGKEYTNDDLSLHIKLRVQNNLLEFES